MDDPYRILGVDRGSAPDEIKRAFRQQALRFHPDRNPDDPQAEASFKEVTWAYELLSDPLKRMQYDRLGRVYTGPKGPSWAEDPADLREIFDRLMTEAFGSNPFTRDRDRHGNDLRYTVSLTLEEVARGTEREVSFERMIACDECGGSGVQSRAEKVLCDECGGSGESRRRGLLRARGRCKACKGEGYVSATPCETCDGDCRLPIHARVKVKVPAGVEVGQRLKVSGRGNAGVRGGNTGDLFVVVDVERHPYFQRDRHDVYCKLPVSFAQLALGADAPVPTLLGKAVIRIPPGTQPEQVLTLVGHGLPRPRGGRRGDQRVRVVLEVPRALDESRRDALLVAAAATDPGDTPLRRQVLDLLDEMG